MAGFSPIAPLLTSRARQGGLTIFPFVTVPHLLVAVRAPTAHKTHWQQHTWQTAGEETRRKREIILCRHSADTGADFKKCLGQCLSTNMDALLARVIAAAQQSSALLPALSESSYRGKLLLLKQLSVNLSRLTRLPHRGPG